ncbi:type I-D CRISPR-associated protein Cas5/Csc1 [Bacillus aquiflavi]|uniref:Type I-D CRISPR-associated protein Cas5/Csc1 n=1 Tax=Bacillus aquiflavi TaxID=2672567 RepID=A0A6B3W2G8_9BACI|nr:type I-D CRISPR-associated protein Cas5/Csc1 [Bacillus aquiflavi]MBA4537825.1 type I-D CRISPR-associated protein Cas5/Csc1 [Bacillus aquiflavi]NEY82081.1 type I-D CRISPR-associated protein Cas5/Csc1 [Bacillus aquiflavi]
MAEAAQKRSRRLSEKKIIEKKYAYLLNIYTEDYVFFASAEKGKVAETFPLVHNYALTYALGFTTAPYYFKEQLPKYEEQLDLLNEKGIYVYPAWQQKGMRRLIQYNTTDEGYLSVRGQSMGIPNWGFIKAIGPGSLFTTIVLSSSPLEFPTYIRLGKWMSLCKVSVSELSIQSANRKASDMLLNVNDLVSLPNYFISFYNMLPSRLLKGAEWEKAIDGYVVELDHFSYFCPESCYFYH